jgi:L-ribulose-5-phosphate 3-epimerase
METRLPLAAITDEFSPELETALPAMAAAGLTGAELRVGCSKNILDWTDEEVERAASLARQNGLEIVALSSPLLKCILPGGGEIDTRFQQDVFASRHSFDDQPRLAARAFAIAHRSGARIIRVFSYWRTVDPEKCFDRIVEALSKLARDAAREDLVVGLENEHACNISTGADAARLLRAAGEPNLKLVWDAANAYVAGETPFPGGYTNLPAGAIAHVHVKDCYLAASHQPVWGPIGACAIDWKGQFAALRRDGYQGWASIETHWAGPGGDKLAGSTMCAWNLRYLLAAV